MTLIKARDALREGKPEDALFHLLAAWRACRDEALAEAIERVSAMVTRPELEGSAKKRHDAFIELAKKGDPADIGRLYAALGEGQIAHFTAELDELEKLPADPRFTTRALQLMQQPKNIGSSSFKVWRRVFNQLTKNEDLRALNAIKALDFLAIFGTQFVYSATFFNERAAKTIDALSKIAPQRLSDADAKLVHDMLATREAATRDFSSLEAAVYATPDDEAPRMVFADALLERSDPRGEFISLQLAARKGRLPAEQRWREYELLEEHREAWLGPLTAAWDKFYKLADFDGGFVHTFALSDKPAAARLITASPAFATVKTLVLSMRPETPLPVELLRSLKHITGIGGLSTTSTGQLFRAYEPWPYEEVHTDSPHFREVDAELNMLCASTALPKLKRLKVSSYSIKPERFAPLWRSEVAARLEGFGAHMGYFQLGDWVQQIEKHGLDARLKSFDLGFNFGVNDFGVLFTRGADGRLSDLEVCKCATDTRYGSPKISKLVERLDAIPPDRLTAFRYLGKLAKADRKLLDATLARQTKLTTIDLR